MKKILREPLSSRTGEYPVKMIMKYKQFKSSYMNKIFISSGGLEPPTYDL